MGGQGKVGSAGLLALLLLAPAADARVASQLFEDEAPRRRKDSRAQILTPANGATLSLCPTFSWTAGTGATQYWLWLGSCRSCADLESRDLGTSLSATVHVPEDGRLIYLTLFSKIHGTWYWLEYLYCAPFPSVESSGVPGEVGAGTVTTPPGDEGRADRRARSCRNPVAKSVGFYHWSSGAGHSMRQGVSRIPELGARIARVTFSARYYSDYSIADLCYPQFSLTSLAQEPDVQATLDNPEIDVFMLTAYDGVSFGDCVTHQYLNPRFYTPENTAALRREYSDFVVYLFQRYAGTGKRFIISNWEADNAIYCGQAYRYATDPWFRAYCGDMYPQLYGNSGPEESLEGMRQWFRARYQGIVDGRLRAAALGLADVEVYFAPEFSNIRTLKENGLESVLHDLIPRVDFDFVSYSSWDSIATENFPQVLAADLDMIREVAGSDNIILGEMGFARSTWGSDVVSRTESAITTALAWGVPYVFQWALYDHDAANNFGLYDLVGDITPVGAYYQGRMRDETSGCARLPHPPTWCPE